MKKFIKEYEIWIFLVLAPLFNTIFVYSKIQGLIPDFAYSHGRFYLLLLLLLFIVRYTKGKKGIKDIFKPMKNWKINPVWYLFSFLFALTIGSITLLIKSFYTDTDYASMYVINIPLLKQTFNILVWAFVGEVVWVSYSVRELAKKTSLFYASQIVGVFWTLWWIPVVYLNVSVITDLPVWALLLNMMGAAGMCAYVYGNTKSGTCVWVLQFMLNMSLVILPVSPAVGGAATYTIFSILYFFTMLGFMYFMNTEMKLKVVKQI